MIDPQLRGTAALVTGGSGGIGAAVCRELAAQGVNLAIHYRTKEPAAASLADRLQREHSVATIALGADLRREEEVEALFSAALDRFGRIDSVVANAGIWPERAIPVSRITLQQWNDTISTNLSGAFLCARAFLRHLESEPRESAGLVFIGSTAGVFGEEGHGDYAASKAALRGLMLTLKNEIVRHTPRGRVHLVDPGWVATPMAKEALQDESTVQRVLSTMALRKVATPEDVARTVLFLLAERLSGHLTGTTITVAGGMEGRLLHPPAHRSP